MRIAFQSLALLAQTKEPTVEVVGSKFSSHQEVIKVYLKSNSESIFFLFKDGPL